MIQAMLEAMAHDLGQGEEYRGNATAIRTYGFSDSPAFEVLVAQRHSEPLGMVLFFYEFSTWRGRPGLYVQDIFVDAAARGLGLGRKLLVAATKKAAKQDACYVRLSVHAANKSGMAFYKQLGFQQANQENIMVLEGAPFDAMKGDAE